MCYSNNNTNTYNMFVGLIEPKYYKHIIHLLDAQTDHDRKLYSNILSGIVRSAVVCDSDKPLVHTITYIKHGWSDTPRTDGSLGWLPFVSVKTCSIVLRNEPMIRMQFLYPEYTVSVKPGEYVIYDYDTTPYRDLSNRYTMGEYMTLNVQYMFVSNWLPFPIIRMYIWLYENTEWLNAKLNGVYLVGLLLYKWMVRK
jgi:hypothetical protein